MSALWPREIGQPASLASRAGRRNPEEEAGKRAHMAAAHKGKNECILKCQHWVSWRAADELSVNYHAWRKNNLLLGCLKSLQTINLTSAI